MTKRISFSPWTAPALQTTAGKTHLGSKWCHVNVGCPASEEMKHFLPVFLFPFFLIKAVILLSHLSLGFPYWDTEGAPHQPSFSLIFSPTTSTIPCHGDTHLVAVLWSFRRTTIYKQFKSDTKEGRKTSILHTWQNRGGFSQKERHNPPNNILIAEFLSLSSKEVCGNIADCKLCVVSSC